MKSNLIILAILSLPFTWIISQGYKVIIGNRVFGKKVTVSNFFADGNFPSTHSLMITAWILSSTPSGALKSRTESAPGTRSWRNTIWRNEPVRP